MQQHVQYTDIFMNLDIWMDRKRQNGWK